MRAGRARGPARPPRCGRCAPSFWSRWRLCAWITRTC